MSQKKKAITNSEWVVMSVLWESSPLMVSDVVEKLSGRVDWGYPTYVTHLNRLVEKGMVGFDMRGGRRFFYPIAHREECIREEGRSLLSRISRNSAKELLAYMIRDANLTEQEQGELRDLLEELKRR